ncbi:hypothetical protein [Phenylobacterium sp.]|jgi:hypothetical protein|uniref:hypothetical protein n=1 Tax=Phenylobacterium sp. TaxID=1871053 RepID=UPI0037CB9DDE
MDLETTLSDQGKSGTPPPASLKTPRRRRHVRDVTILSWMPWYNARDFWVWLAMIGLWSIVYMGGRALFNPLEFRPVFVISLSTVSIIFRFPDRRSSGLADPLDRKAIIGALERNGFWGDVGASPETYRPTTKDWFSDQSGFVTLEAKGDGLRVTGPLALLRRL